MNEGGPIQMEGVEGWNTGLAEFMRKHEGKRVRMTFSYPDGTVSRKLKVRIVPNSKRKRKRR